MCYQPHTNQTDLWQFLLPQNAKCFLKFVVKLASLATGVTSSSQLSQLHYMYFGSNHFIPIQLLSYYVLVIYWFFGDPKLSYTCAFGELFLNIDTNQWYLSKYENMLVLLPLYCLQFYITVTKAA